MANYLNCQTDLLWSCTQLVKSLNTQLQLPMSSSGREKRAARRLTLSGWLWELKVMNSFDNLDFGKLCSSCTSLTILFCWVTNTRCWTHWGNSSHEVQQKKERAHDWVPNPWLWCGSWIQAWCCWWKYQGKRNSLNLSGPYQQERSSALSGWPRQVRNPSYQHEIIYTSHSELRTYWFNCTWYLSVWRPWRKPCWRSNFSSPQSVLTWLSQLTWGVRKTYKLSSRVKSSSWKPSLSRSWNWNMVLWFSTFYENYWIVTNKKSNHFV